MQVAALLVAVLVVVGAPPRPAYFMQILDTVANLGATGIVIEWEDMFPFSGQLEKVRNGNAYSMKDVEDILDHASKNNLDVIPLIQTLGHFEWVLKTEDFKHLREVEHWTNVACIGLDEARALILDMVAKVHSKFSMPYFHIGMDEVPAAQIGVCDGDKKRMAEIFNNSVQAMKFDHIRALATELTSDYAGVQVLMWFDELHTATNQEIKEFDLDKLVIPVVWNYRDNLDQQLPLEMWRNLSHSWTAVWGASAFKGADHANNYWNPVKPYVQNNKQWFLQSVKYSQLFPDFHGVILTGWQRYDHFATLCELWPVSMASLALSLNVLEKFIISDIDADAIMRSLKCPTTENLTSVIGGDDKCSFPGYKARNAIRNYKKLKTFWDKQDWLHKIEEGWLMTSHKALAASNTWNTDKIKSTYQQHLTNMEKNIIPALTSSLKELYFEDAVEEFLLDNVYTFYNDLRVRYTSVQRLDAKTSFRPRPWFPLLE